MKRWTDHEGFHEILKCRYCDWHERRDIPLKVSIDATTIESRKRVIIDSTGHVVTQSRDSQVEIGSKPDAL